MGCIIKYQFHSDIPESSGAFQPHTAKMIVQVALFCLISMATSAPYDAPVYEPVYDERPEPYSFGFDTKDEYGATINREEVGDELGNKKGSYGYTDGYGIYRQVDYVADEHGFRAVVKTNEPGTENQNPADTEIVSEARPVQYDAPSAYAHAPVAYPKSAALVAPAYSKPVAAVYNPAPVYDAAPAGYASGSVYNAVPVSYAPAPVSYAPAPVSYAPAPVSYAHAPVYGAAPLHAPAYEHVASPVYSGPSYEQLADKAGQSKSSSAASYEPEAVESYSSY